MRHERIAIKPDVMFGKPVIRGKRVTVEQILRKLAAGMTPEEIVRDHPRLTVADVHAAQHGRAAFGRWGTTPMLSDGNHDRSVDGQHRRR